MRFPFFRNRDSVKNGILISIRRTGDGFHPGLFTFQTKRIHCFLQKQSRYLRSFHARRYNSCRRALYCDWVKVLLWENDGFVLLYKRMEVKGRFRWPRSSQEVRQLTWQQFNWLMSGLEIEQPKAFKTL